MISSAKATESSAAQMSAASFLVLTVTESFGNGGVFWWGRRWGGTGWGGGGMGWQELSLPACPACPARPALLLLRPDVPVRVHDGALAGRREAVANAASAGTAAERDDLDGLEVHDRLVVVGNRLDFR